MKDADRINKARNRHAKAIEAEYLDRLSAEYAAAMERLKHFYDFVSQEAPSHRKKFGKPIDPDAFFSFMQSKRMADVDAAYRAWKP